MSISRDFASLANQGVSAAEFNKLDGVTATTAELNKLAGATATTAELNKLAGATATTVELNKLTGYTGTTAELNALDTTAGVAGNATFLRGDKQWAAAGSTDASDLDTGTLAAARLPSGAQIQVVTGEFNGGSNSYAVTGAHPGTEITTNVRFSIIPVLASSKILVSYQSTKVHANAVHGRVAIGHQVTASNGTPTASTMLGQLVTVAEDTDDHTYFQVGIIGAYFYITPMWEVIHSPSYTVGQKIWYTLFGFAGPSSGTWYLTNDGDVRFKAIEIKA